MKVLVSGGGIAGNALAFWLSKLGHEVTVVERFPSLRTTGLQLDLRGHGIEVMKRMGLEQGFRSKIAPENGLQIVDKSGRRRAWFPANKSGKGLQDFTTEFEIMRGDLCRLIFDAAKDRTKYLFGTWIESFEQKDSSVEVRFANGTTDRFDLLVGADGQGSRTRRMMLGTDAPDALYPLKDNYMGYFTIPRPIEKGEDYIATIYMAPASRCIMVRRHSPTAIQVYLICTSDSERLKNARPGDTDEEKAAFTEIFKGIGWQADDILKSLESNEDFYCERVGLVKLDSWSKGSVALVGDACYCPTVKTGMGTTSAMVGAYVLAGEIGRHCGGSGKGDANREGGSSQDLTAALKAYEERFRPFMTQVQKGVQGEDWMPQSSFGIGMLNLLFGVASFFRINVLGSFVLKEGGVKEWELPEYEEMLRD